MPSRYHSPVTHKVQLSERLLGTAILVTDDPRNTVGAALHGGGPTYPAHATAATRPAVIYGYVATERGGLIRVDLETSEGPITNLPAGLPVIPTETLEG